MPDSTSAHLATRPFGVKPLLSCTGARSNDVGLRDSTLRRANGTPSSKTSCNGRHPDAVGCIGVEVIYGEFDALGVGERHEEDRADRVRACRALRVRPRLSYSHAHASSQVSASSAGKIPRRATATQRSACGAL